MKFVDKFVLIPFERYEQLKRETYHDSEYRKEEGEYIRKGEEVKLDKDSYSDRDNYLKKQGQEKLSKESETDSDKYSKKRGEEKIDRESGSGGEEYLKRSKQDKLGELGKHTLENRVLENQGEKEYSKEIGINSELPSSHQSKIPRRPPGIPNKQKLLKWDKLF